ncbi:sterol desaturase family protein [Sphingobium sp. Sx8-8]|uniref:sterol desaturase family protein n=1 Tax=Sphingobium sp. Sx8-8 TaxID=2933617 RepID=UPI001F5631B1|nr:sterol desaturase family protein [Sphingobium sp. Sx8-8]
MEKLPVRNTLVPEEGPVAADRSDVGWKQTLFNLVPPAFVAIIIAFWAFAPKEVTGNDWTIVVTSALITLIVLGLEFVHERHAGWRMNWREFFTDLFYVVLSATVISWATSILADEPLKGVKTSLGITTPWAMHLPWLAQVAAVVFIIEFGQYWMHRLMHNWTPFWLTHAPHHHITQLNAAKGAVGNPIELFLISLSAVALFDFSPTAIFCAFNVLNVVSTFAHANVRSDPPKFYSLFFTTIRHHSLHHSADYESTRCNYANSLILIDRVLGTYREGEGVIVGQDDLRRLSIREQFMFPFQPLIDRIRTKRSQAMAGAS